MPPKKKQSEEDKKLEQDMKEAAKKLEKYRKDVFKAMIKLKRGTSRNLLYDKGDNFNTKISEMKSDELFDFRAELDAEQEVRSPEETAQELSAKALKLKIIKPRVLEKVKDESATKREEKVKDEKDSKDEKESKDEPVPVSDPPNKPLIDSKDEPTSSFSDNQKKTEDKEKDEPVKSTKSSAEKQKVVREKQKDRINQEKEAIYKQAIEEGKKLGRSETLQDIKEGKLEPPQLEGKISPTVQTVRDIVPGLVAGSATILAPRIGKQFAPTIKGVTSSIVNRLTEMFRSSPETKISVKIPNAEYKFRQIPLGLQGFYKHMEKYFSVYNRLNPEQKSKLQDTDRKLMTIQQSQTRSQQNDKKTKSYYSQIGRIINIMDQNIQKKKSVDNDIEILNKIVDNQPQTITANIIPLLDNRLQLGLAQVMEMKRSGNFLPTLIGSSAQRISLLDPPQIVEALNNVISNVTEVERGAIKRVSDSTIQIPQITEAEALEIKQIFNTTPITIPEDEFKLSSEELNKRLADSSLFVDDKVIQQSESESKEEKQPPTSSLFVDDKSSNKVNDQGQTQTEQKQRGSVLRRLGKYVAGAVGVGGIASTISDKYADVTADVGTAIVSEISKNIYSNIMETPIKIPETQAQSDQKISSSAGTMRPRFIVPSRDSVIPSMPKIRADDIQFAAFDYVQPGTEGGNGNARTNPLVLSQELEERLRYSNAGITISPGMGENVVNITLTESELKALLLPRGPEISPVIYEFPIIDGDQSQNEVKKYDQNLIQVEKFSPYNEYNNNDQLDEEIFGSILLSYVP